MGKMGENANFTQEEHQTKHEDEESSRNMSFHIGATTADTRVAKVPNCKA
jgi:hypothetical protein